MVLFTDMSRAATDCAGVLQPNAAATEELRRFHREETSIRLDEGGEERHLVCSVIGDKSCVL